MPESDKRRQQILDAAVARIVRHGYDKTTMGDIADEAGVSRGTVYLYFKGKDELFEALVYREYLEYARTWLELVESDPRGGTVGGYYRATLSAVNSRPLIAALMRRDPRIVGSYLRQRDNLFAWNQAGPIVLELLRSLQKAGTIRKDVDAGVAAHIIEMLGYGQLSIAEWKPADQLPPYNLVMETLADMMDRALTPEGGGNNQAGKAVVRRFVARVIAQLERVKEEKDEQKEGDGAQPTRGQPSRGVRK
jgi:TetR/AcrR family acrAB operon transcriptional repressor